MFPRLPTMVVGALALASMAKAAPAVDCPVNQENDCCDQFNTVGNLLKNPSALPLGVVEVLLTLDVNALVGVGCVPVLLNNVCTQQNVCCPDNQSNSLVFVGCNNVNV